MKFRFLFKIILFFLFCGTSSFADEIYLKNGKIIKCKILRISEKNIEYDPIGDKPFNLVPKAFVQKYIFSKKKIEKKSKSSPKWTREQVAATSLIPFWSGSFKKDYNNWGTFFSISKSTSLILFFYSLDKAAYYYDKAVQNEMDGKERIAKEFSKKEEKWGNIFFGSFYTYLILTILDIRYSVKYIFTAKKMRKLSLKRKAESNLHFIFLPRIGNKTIYKNYLNDLNGFNLKIIYRF